MTLRLY